MTDHTTTAAAMQPIVEAWRAEGLNRKALFLRYFRTARPDGEAVSSTDCDTADWKIGGTWFYAFDDLYTCVITEDAMWEEVAGRKHESEASALAWLANELRERCPVVAMPDESAEIARLTARIAELEAEVIRLSRPSFYMLDGADMSSEGDYEEDLETELNMTSEEEVPTGTLLVRTVLQGRWLTPLFVVYCRTEDGIKIIAEHDIKAAAEAHLESNGMETNA